MSGITRIEIVSDWDDWRLAQSRKWAPAANDIYRQIFALEAEEVTERCTKEEARSRYDWQEGIDVILRSRRGTKKTLQEKFLDYTEWTATFEEEKNSGEPGAWYYCSAQYYFVGYVDKSSAGLLKFKTWILIDLPALHREDEAGNVPWGNIFSRTADNPLGIRRNGKDGRHNPFRFVAFHEVPKSSVIHARYGRTDTLSRAQQLILF